MQLQAQYPGIGSSSEILQGITELQETRSVLYIAAHPDDENTRLLGWLAKEKKVRAGYLSLTRGDGGQNLIGGEQGIELGLIRTQELLAARRTDGAEQFFTRAYDFGFSKTTAETLEKWGHEQVLADVVFIIRKFRPHVIITRFPPDSRAGHGHHSASALLAKEAYEAAADPRRFPQQVREGLLPWQATRLLWNTFNFGGNTNTIREGQFRLNVGGYNALLGKGYGEIASESRSQHKSQGFGVPRLRGNSFEYFETLAGTPPVQDLLDGVESMRTYDPLSALLNRSVPEIISRFQPVDPRASLPSLLELRARLLALKPGPDGGLILQRKLKAFNQIIARCAGLYAEAVTNTASASPGDSVTLNLYINAQQTQPALRPVKWTLIGAIEGVLPLFPDSLQTNVPMVISRKWLVGPHAPYTEPYWLKNPARGNLFQIPEGTLGMAWFPAAVEATLHFKMAGQELEIVLPVQFKYTSEVNGEMFEPFTILPRTETRYLQDLYVSVNGAEINVVTESSTPQGRTLPKLTTTAITPAQTGLQPLTLLPEVIFRKTIQYDHISPVTYLRRQPAQLLNLNIVRTAGRRIGYISGAGDRVAEALQTLGYAVEIIDPEKIASTNLSVYSTIVTGIRAYNVHPALNSAYDPLMRYIQEGGHLLVQYNTNNQLGILKGRMAPYPFVISRTRITEEEAAVKINNPTHLLLTTPNKIRKEDFDNWVQERSIYQAEQWSPEYESLFSMQDTGEQASGGSLITAVYGKGRFTYTGLVFFRQLPAGVEGAYRLLANLVEAGK